jgi:hypothetical protein
MHANEWSRVELARGVRASLVLDHDSFEWPGPVTGRLLIATREQPFPVRVARVRLATAVDPPSSLAGGAEERLLRSVSTRWFDVAPAPNSTLSLRFSLTIPEGSRLRPSVEVLADLQPVEVNGAEFWCTASFVPPAEWQGAASALAQAADGTRCGWTAHDGGIAAGVTPGVEWRSSVDYMELAWPVAALWREVEVRIYPTKEPLAMLLRSLTRRFCHREPLTLQSEDPAGLVAQFSAALRAFRPRDAALRDLPIAAEAGDAMSLPFPGERPD